MKAGLILCICKFHTSANSKWIFTSTFSVCSNTLINSNLSWQDDAHWPQSQSLSVSVEWASGWFTFCCICAEAYVPFKCLLWFPPTCSTLHTLLDENNKVHPVTECYSKHISPLNGSLYSTYKHLHIPLQSAFRRFNSLFCLSVV